MSITLLCLVKGNTLANAFPVDINKDQLVGHLKKAIKAEKHKTFHGVRLTNSSYGRCRSLAIRTIN